MPASSVSFPLRLDPAVKLRLDDEARRAGHPASLLATQAIEAFLKARDARNKAVEQALAEADKGVFISQQAMNAWMDSWDTDEEKPIPEPDVFA